METIFESLKKLIINLAKKFKIKTIILGGGIIHRKRKEIKTNFKNFKSLKIILPKNKTENNGLLGAIYLIKTKKSLKIP